MQPYFLFILNLPHKQNKSAAASKLHSCEKAEHSLSDWLKAWLSKTNQTSATELCLATREADEGKCFTKNPHGVKTHINNKIETHLYYTLKFFQ